MHKKVVAFASPVGELGERLHHLGEAAGVERLAEGFHRVRESIASAGEKLGEFLGPLAALGGLTSLAGLGEIAVKTGELGEQLERASKKIGIGVENLQRLQFAARANEVPVESLETGLTRLNRVIADAASGKNKDAASMFQHLGINLRDARHHLLDAASVFPLLSDAMVKNTDAAIRTRIAMAAMGKGGADMLPMMLAGSEGLRKWGEEAEHVGLLNEEQIGGAARLGESLKMLRLTIDGISNAIGARLSPVLTPLIDHLTDWLQLHREIIATHVEHVVIQLAKAIDSVDWISFLKGVERVVEAVGRFAARTLGLNGTLIALTGIIAAPLISALLNIGAALIGLGMSAVPIALTGFGLLIESTAGLSLKAALALGSLSELAAGVPILGAALEGMSGVFVALGAAIEATPIGWILTGIAAVAFAAYEIYEHWTDLGNFWHGWWDNASATVKAAVLGMVNAISPLLGTVFQLTGLLDARSPAAGLKSSLSALQTHMEGLRLQSLPIATLGPSLALPGGMSGGFGGRAPDIGAMMREAEASRGDFAKGGNLGQIEVIFRDVPRGTRVMVKETGAVSLPANVGYNMRDDD